MGWARQWKRSDMNSCCVDRVSTMKTVKRWGSVREYIKWGCQWRPLRSRHLSWEMNDGKESPRNKSKWRINYWQETWQVPGSGVAKSLVGLRNWKVGAGAQAREVGRGRVRLSLVSQEKELLCTIQVAKGNHQKVWAKEWCDPYLCLRLLLPPKCLLQFDSDFDSIYWACILSLSPY